MMKLRKCRKWWKLWTITIVFYMAPGENLGQSTEQNTQIIPLGSGAYRKEIISPFPIVLMPAAGVFEPKKSIGLYAENRFMLKGVADIQGAANIPIRSTVFSLSGHYRGSRFFSTQSIATGIGIKLSDRLSVGLKIGSQWMRISSAPTMNTIIMHGGLMYAINERVLWGVHVKKGIRANSTQGKAISHLEYGAGLGYILNKQVYLAYEISASSVNQVISRISLDWKATEKIHFRAGINNPLSNFFFAAAKKGKHEMVSIGFSSHAVLGYSGAILLEYELQ